MRGKDRKKNKKNDGGLHTIVAEKLLNAFYPPRCPLCDEILAKGEGRCCESCRPSLPWIREPACMKCGKPVEREEQEYCADCRNTAHWFDQGRAAFAYNTALRHSVHRMKFDNRRDYLDFYAEAIVHACSRSLKIWQPELILPVPMHPKKRRRRGYNQSELLAEKVGAITGIPVNRNLLECVRVTASQKELDRKGRMQNLKGSIRAVTPFPGLKRVLLIDDVYTTGSTMDEISRVLKEQGVSCVFFAVLCTGNDKKTVCRAEKLCYTENND